MATPVPKELTKTDESRGIQNATSRFKRQRAGQTLQSELLSRTERGKGVSEAANNPSHRKGRGRYLHRVPGASVSLENELERLSQEEDFQYEKGDAEKFIANPPDKPIFPVIMLLVGAFKDAIDLAGITGIGILVTMPVSFLMAVVLFIYFLGKMNGIQRWLWKRYVFATIISFVPFLQALPETTLLVFLAYHHENKVVNGITEALQKMSGGGLLR